MKKNISFLSRICADYPVLCSIAAVLLWICFTAIPMWKSGELYYLDTDCYTRYLRITDWLSGDFSWFEKIFPYTNCPYGEVLHFTRINDILWLLISIPFMPFMPIKEAIFTGGMFFSPLMLVATLAIIICGIKKFVGEKDFLKPSLFVFVFSFIFLTKSMFFGFGRPDHHSLMLLIAAILSMNLLQPTEKKMFWSGIFAAIGIWASSAVEGMFLAYGILAVLCIGIFFYKNTFSLSYKYTLGLFVGVLSAYLLNPPYEGYLDFSNSRLSLIHVAVCAFTLIVFGLGKVLKFENNLEKICLLISGAAVSSALLTVFFGFETIFAPIISEKVLYIFTAHITENSYSLPQEDMYLILGSLETLILYRFFRLKTFGYSAIYMLFFIYLPLSAWLRRFLPYEILFFSIINAFMLIELFKRISNSDKYKWLTLGLITADLLFAVSFTYAVTPTRATYSKLNGCALSDLFFAPQLIYKTGITTIASPYHNNVEGISYTIDIFSETNETIIRNKLKKRNVRYVIIPDYELVYLAEAPENSFYKRLFNGYEYGWLKLLNNKEEAYRFYEITR